MQAYHGGGGNYMFTAYLLAGSVFWLIAFAGLGDNL